MNLHLRNILFLFTFLTIGSTYAQDPVKGQIAPELVGKWCYYNLANGDEGKITDTCVTLNDNGSYEFVLDNVGRAQARMVFAGVSSGQTDYGDWWAEGNRIFYRSQSAGAGSFQLQKINQPPDRTVPMIVLNGLSFVATSPKDPW